MSSVTQRVTEVKQPYGGYLTRKDFQMIQLQSKTDLDDIGLEGVSPALVGLAVEYLTRFMLGENINDVFQISIRGAEIVHCKTICRKYLKSIKGLDDGSIVAALNAASFDVCYRSSPLAYNGGFVLSNRPVKKNIRKMVERSLEFFKQYGPVVASGFTFEGGYTESVDKGDGDFLTADTLWDFKVSVHKPTSMHRLQLLIYYLLGAHSGQDRFKTISKIGIYNPRLNQVYVCEVGDIPKDIIEAVEKEVIGY